MSQLHGITHDLFAELRPESTPAHEPPPLHAPVPVPEPALAREPVPAQGSAPVQAFVPRRAPAVLRGRRPAPHPQPRELWVGACLHDLPLEALGLGRSPRPVAVVELRDRVQCVVAADEHARRHGVRPGMGLAAAMALVPVLETRPRDIRRERRLLERLAHCALGFTPRVSFVPEDGLLLEVKGSLHLFGGAEGLCRAFADACAGAGARPCLALAPTPLAALTAARAGCPLVVTDPAQLVGRLAPLPLSALRWPEDVLERLSRMGVRTIGQALRLPREGFARRFGTAQLDALDRLTGRRPDPRADFRPRERFHARREPAYELEHHDAILETLAPLLRDLERFLQARQCGITQLECLLHHRHAPATRCVLACAAPTASAQRIEALLEERLARLTLPEPVRVCELRSGPLVPLALSSDSLWQSGEHGGGANGESPAFIERLRARLGDEAVYGLRLFGAHRPEMAWRSVAPDEAGVRGADAQRPPWPAFRRPLWLLPVPQRLTEREGRPHHHGPLRLVGGPERIETGWWDGGEVTRDYYVAVDVRGVRLWIFRERSPPHAWFLHGVFG
ncbi:MAG: DNA polymerase Y family protein [Pseudomonadota bacterium]|nr:MAG: DNA polymerase Y family protein [Pseudomonadota bacterium]